MSFVRTMAAAIAACLCAIAAKGESDGFRVESVGPRYGFSNHSGTDRFSQIDAYSKWNLPWRWNLGAGWTLRPQLDLSAGGLHQGADDGFVGTLGPALNLSRKNFPLTFMGGISPTVLSEHNFNSKNLGSRLQFTSYLGLRYKLGAHFELGYSFQHMSNGGLSRPNPGLNLNMFSIGYRF